jgi:cytochrome oxidase Cu insertion factor (SCO1/SenC/PrrC family)
LRIRLAFTAIAAFVAGAIGALAMIADRDSVGAPVVVEDADRPDIGGPFSLVTHTGAPLTQDDLIGRYTLIMFGFTHCPDICPAELQVVMSALDKLGDKAEQVTPVFVTLDPERDTVNIMAQYVSHFGDRLVGLTGTPEQIDQAAKAYRVYHARVADKDGDGYSIDHSSIAYLMGPDGRYRTHFAYGASAEDLARGISRQLGS